MHHFPNPTRNVVHRRVGARGLQPKSPPPVGRVPSRGGWCASQSKCEIWRLGAPASLPAFFSFLVLTLALTTHAADWPQFLGPNRNGIYPGTEVGPQWPKEGPPQIWNKTIGQGFSGVTVAEGRLILFHRIENKETVECLESRTGKPIWSHDYPTGYRDDFGFDEGPRATPSISGKRVYTYGAEGVLLCLDLDSGKKVWDVDTRKEFQAPKGFFGIACSPLVDGDSVFLNVGGKNGAGVVAFDRAGGKVRWKSTDDEASYSSPVSAKLSGQSVILFLTRANLVAADPGAGKVIWETPFRPPIRSSVSAATPLVIDDLVFLSASYGTGAQLLRIKDTKPQPVWSGDAILSNHYATSIQYHGFLYGIHGRTDPGFEPTANLRCVELLTGKVRWEEKGFGAATMILAGDQLLILNERGELIRAPASPNGYHCSARTQVLPNQVRAHPALANGLLYARSKDKLVCLDLR